MGKPRILFIDHTAAMGGGEIALLALLSNLNRTEFELLALLFDDGPLVDKLPVDIQTHVLPLGKGIAETRKDSLGAKSVLKVASLFQLGCFVLRVAKFIRTQQIDLVYTNSLKADIIGGIAARLARRPVVWHVRDRISYDYLPRTVVKVFRALARIVPTFIIANSAATLETLALGDASSAKAEVVHDAIDVSSIAVVPPSGIRRFGLIGRISPWKGQHIFLRAAAEVYRRHPKMSFVIVGGPLFGEEEYETEIKGLCAELGLTEAVEFTGFRSDVAQCIAGLDVVVHASTSGEPFGQVIIEGMAAGKPVIATKGGGVPEIVQDGATGILVPMNDVRSMSQAMEWMVGHPTDAIEMGARSRIRVAQCFAIPRLASQIQNIFNRLVTLSPGQDGPLLSAAQGK